MNRCYVVCMFWFRALKFFSDDKEIFFFFGANLPLPFSILMSVYKIEFIDARVCVFNVLFSQVL